ncbi:MAG: hypothetical protein GY748_16320 [Planctomycetaceae bacterium]|nr:hypothetical protein [Planctomycetaceae bacterium]
MNNKQQKTEWRGLEIELAALEQLVQETVEIPNSWLPKEYQHGVDGGRTVSDLNSKLDRKFGVSKHKKNKAIKAENVERYAKQMEENAEIEYDLNRDENQLFKNESALVQAWIDTRVIDAEDLENEV